MRLAPRPAEAGHSEDGFTLVEVLVAFAIAALGTMLALQIVGETSASLRKVASLNIEADAVESICLQRLGSGPLRSGALEGHFIDGRPWTLTVSDARADLPSRGGPPLWRLRLTRGGADGPAIYTTLVSGKPDA